MRELAWGGVAVSAVISTNVGVHGDGFPVSSTGRLRLLGNDDAVVLVVCPAALLGVTLTPALSRRGRGGWEPLASPALLDTGFRRYDG